MGPLSSASERLLFRPILPCLRRLDFGPLVWRQLGEAYLALAGE
jgi:hypothetical protein